MRLIDHPQWAQLKSRVRIVYDQRGGSKNPRARFEVPDFGPDDVFIEATCSNCGDTINPVRVRKGVASAYVALTCPLPVKMGCARSGAARQAYNDLEADLTR